MQRLSSFNVDFNKESHLILPFSHLSKESEIFQDEQGNCFIKTYGYLFAVSDRLEVDISYFLSMEKLKHFLFPVKEVSEDCRFLLYKKGGDGIEDNLATSSELDEFYFRHTPFDVDEEYIEERIKQGEAIYTIRDEKEKILSACYTTKGRRQLVDVATNTEFQKKGYATLLVKK